MSLLEDFKKAARIAEAAHTERPTPATFEEAARRILDEAVTIMIRKQRDYGSGNISAFGEFGVLVRASDKIERLKNLLDPRREGCPTNEPIEDSWQDLLNYACIALMLRRGWWGLPLEPRRGRLK